MAETARVHTGAVSKADTPSTREVGKTADSTREAEKTDSARDRFGHLVCFLCYPAFDGALKAPHDAVCLCGKPIRRGEAPGKPGAELCVVCSKLWLDHRALTHARPRP
jgi:hypothetical protein